jgi:hypothetical protein
MYHGGSYGTTQVTSRVPEPLKEAFKETCDARDVTMTDAIQKLVESYVVETGGGVTLDEPDEPKLAEAYRKLRMLTGPRRRCPVDEAESFLAEQTGTPKRAVRASLLDPLRDEGYVEYRWGVLKVGPFTDPRDYRHASD